MDTSAIIAIVVLAVLVVAIIIVAALGGKSRGGGARKTMCGSCRRAMMPGWTRCMFCGWQPPAAVNGKSSLIGFPLADTEDMPDVAANSLSIAFGDFRRGYLIVDRVGIRILRDPYSSKPYVLFYTTKRVGGGVQDFDAIKLLKFSVS